MKEFKNIKLKPDVVYQSNDDGMMVYVSEEGMIHTINLTAADVLLFVEQGVDSLEGLTEKMLEKYIGVIREELSADIRNILNSMEELDIVEGL